MAVESKKIVAIAWYNPGDYAEVRELMDDGYVLPEDYEVWRRRAASVMHTELAQGSVVLRAVILPEAFKAWCDATMQRPDVRARLAIEDYCAGVRTPGLATPVQAVS